MDASRRHPSLAHILNHHARHTTPNPINSNLASPTAHSISTTYRDGCSRLATQEGRMAIRALHDHVIVERESAHDLFEIVGHKEHRGRVVAVGPGKFRKDPETDREWFCPMTIKVGDRVLFSHRAGMEQDIEGRKLLVMHEADILCALDDDASIDLGADWRQEACQVVGTYNVGGNGKAVRV